MLVFSRNPKGTFVIVKDGKVIAKITYVGENHKRPGQVKFGIDADEELEVHRSEIWERIKKEGRKKI